MRERKKYWLMPMILILLLLGVLIVIGGGSAVAPFIYTLFESRMMKLNREKSLEAVLVICTGLLILFWIFDNANFLIAAIIIGIAALLSSFLAGKIAFVWYKLAEFLGRINGFIILTGLFFLFLTPLAWLSKLFKKDELQLKKKTKPEGSYFIERNHTFSKKDLENLW